MVIILDLSHPIAWLVRHVCSDKAEFSFLQKKTAFWCSFKRVPNWRLVCPIYSLSQSLHGIVCSTDVSIYNQALHRQEAYLTTKKVRKEFLCCIAKTKSWRQDPSGKYSYDRRLTGKLLTVLRTFDGFVDNMC